MKLYHYTGAEHLDGIRRFGLVASPGAFLGLGIDGVPAVWLTSDPDWSRQTWATRELVACDRSEARVELELSAAETYLYRWRDLGPKLCAMAGGSLGDLMRFNIEGYADWWVYLRSIPKERLGAIERRT